MHPVSGSRGRADRPLRGGSPQPAPTPRDARNRAVEAPVYLPVCRRHDTTWACPAALFPSGPMSYALAIRLCAFVLLLACLGFAAALARPIVARRGTPVLRWPDFALRGGVIGLLCSFGTLALTCVLIAER